MSGEEKAAIVLQKFILAYNAAESYRKARTSSSSLKKRQGLIEELKETEGHYCQKLQTVVTTFLKPLTQNSQSDTPFITPAEVRSLFSEVEMVLGLSKILWGELDKAATPEAVANIFINNQTEFRGYNAFCAEFGKVHNIVMNLKKNQPKFKDFLAKAEREAKEDLESSLIRIVQRVPQYNMLLGGILENTQPEDKAYEVILASVNTMLSVGRSINAFVKDKENMEKVFQLASQFVGFPDLGEVHRRHVFDSKYEDAEDSKDPKQLFLFNDIFFVTRPPAQPKDPNPKYEVLSWCYLLNAKGMPFLLASDLEGDVFSLLVKDKAFSFKTTLKGYDALMSVLEEETEKQKKKFDAAKKGRSKKLGQVDTIPALFKIWPEGIRTAEDVAAKCTEIQSPALKPTWGMTCGLRDKSNKYQIPPSIFVISQHHIHFVDATKYKIKASYHQTNIISINYIFEKNEIHFNCRESQSLQLETWEGIFERCDLLLEALKYQLSIHFPGHEFPGLAEHQPGTPLKITNNMSKKFTRVYQANSNFLKHETKPEEFDKILAQIQNSTESQDPCFNSNLFNFEGQDKRAGAPGIPTSAEDLQVVVRSVSFLSYFSELSIANEPPATTKQTFPFYIELLGNSIYIKKITFTNIQIPRDLVIQLGSAIEKNPFLPLTTLQFQNVPLNDTAFSSMIGVVEKFQLETIEFSKCQDIKKNGKIFLVQSKLNMLPP